MLLSHKLGGLLGLFGVIIKHIFHLGLGTFTYFFVPHKMFPSLNLGMSETPPPPIWAMFPNFTHFFLSCSLRKAFQIKILGQGRFFEFGKDWKLYDLKLGKIRILAWHSSVSACVFSSSSITFYFMVNCNRIIAKLKWG